MVDWLVETAAESEAAEREGEMVNRIIEVGADAEG